MTSPLRETHLRLIYSLLKPAVRAAARFHVPIRTLADLVRIAYFELLAHEGMAQSQIARRLGQSERHMRSLARKLKTDFFAAEQEVGLVREVEDLVASRSPLEKDVSRALRNSPPRLIEEAVSLLLSEQRIVRAPQGRLDVSRKYVVLSSDGFSNRIDALNHFLDGAYRAVMHRLVFDDRNTAMMKTVSFSAHPGQLATFMKRLEGELRRDIAALEEAATFEGQAEHRYTFGLTFAPLEEDRGRDTA